MIFAKLYETEKYGQILVKLDQSNDNGAEIRFYAQPEGLGVCSVAVSYGDEDADWDFAEEVFAKITQQEAEVRVQPIFQLVGEREGNGGEIHQRSATQSGWCKRRLSHMRGAAELPFVWQ